MQASGYAGGHDSSGLKKLNEEIWKKIPKEQVILHIGEINQGAENLYTEV